MAGILGFEGMLGLAVFVVFTLLSSLALHLRTLASKQRYFDKKQDVFTHGLYDGVFVSFRRQTDI